MSGALNVEIAGVDVVIVPVEILEPNSKLNESTRYLNAGEDTSEEVLFKKVMELILKNLQLTITNVAI